MLELKGPLITWDIQDISSVFFFAGKDWDAERQVPFVSYGFLVGGSPWVCPKKLWIRQKNPHEEIVMDWGFFQF